MVKNVMNFASRPHRFAGTYLADVCQIDDRLPPTQWAQDLPEEYVTRAKRVRRKWWEWEYLVESARACDMLDGKRHAVGLAVGCEPLIFYFANHCREVLATDLYSADTPWLEAQFAGPDAVADVSPIPFNADHLSIKNMDMRALDLPDASQDFVWSTSSIEHVPTLTDLLTVFREMARVLKPGGYAFLTTEFSLLEKNYLLPGLLAMDEDLLGQFLSAMTAFEPIGFQDLRYNWTHPNNAPTPRRYTPIHARPPVVSRELCDFEGGGLIALMVGMSAVAPVGFTLRRRSSGIVPQIEDLGLPQHVLEYTRAVQFNQTRLHNTPEQSLAMVERLTEQLALGPQILGEQLMLMIYRQYIDALSHATRANRRDVMLPVMEWGLDLVESCNVLDADCLDLVSYFLQEFGEDEKCAGLTRRIAWSPSTTNKHAVDLGVRYYKCMERLGRPEKGLDELTDLLADMASTGTFHRDRIVTYYWRKIGQDVLESWLAEAGLGGNRIPAVLQLLMDKISRRADEYSDLFVYERKEQSAVSMSS